MRERPWPAGAYAAEFASAEQLSNAVRSLAAKGYTRLETYAPVPAAHALAPGRSRLPVIVFLGGLAGAIASYAIQWYANAYAYPLDIGGRPSHAIPAFLIATFEGAVLCAALAAFFGFFFITKLPQPWHPVFEIDGFDRASVDRYWVAVDARDRRSDPELTPRELRGLSPVRVVRLGNADA